MKKNILHIIQGGKGGTLEYIKLLLKYSDKQFISTIICSGEIYEELTALGYNTYKVEMARNISPKNDIKSLYNIVNYIRKNQVDIVYCHSSKAGALGRIASFITHKYNVYNPHGWSFNMRVSKKKQLFYSFIEKILSIFCNKIIMISEQEYQSALDKHICSRDKLILIKNGVDISKFYKNSYKENIKSLNIPDDYKIIGMCARLEEQKAPLTFVEIAKLVTDKYKKCKFILVGDGYLKDKVTQRIKDLQLEDKFILVGWTNHPEKYISIMDIGVLTSVWEGFGLSLAEYMSSSVPIVASNVDGIPYVVKDNEDGFLCNPNDINAFTQNILNLLYDNDLYNKFSKSAFEHACNDFNITRVIKEHEKLFNNIKPSSPSREKTANEEQKRLLNFK